MKTPEYLKDEDLEQAMRLYDITDREMQVTAVGYMYGMPNRELAGELRDTLSDVEVANSYDYFLTRGLPTQMRLEMYQSLKTTRETIMLEHEIGAIDAVVKRREMEQEAYNDFTKAVESVSGLPGDLIQ